MQKRKYFGTVHLNKVYTGEKSINIVIEPKETVTLARLILKASETGNNFDMTIYQTKKRVSDNKINMTITQRIK